MAIQILHGNLDLMTLRTLATLGRKHAYGIDRKLRQVSDSMNLNQGHHLSGSNAGA
jgi:hypothetical protein